MYLNCSRCGLSLHARRLPHIEPEYCPRCLARARVLQRLVRAPMTLRDLDANPDDGNGASGAASEASALPAPDVA